MWGCQFTDLSNRPYSPLWTRRGGVVRFGPGFTLLDLSVQVQIILLVFSFNGLEGKREVETLGRRGCRDVLGTEGWWDLVDSEVLVRIESPCKDRVWEGDATGTSLYRRGEKSRTLRWVWSSGMSLSTGGGWGVSGVREEILFLWETYIVLTNLTRPTDNVRILKRRIFFTI